MNRKIKSASLSGEEKRQYLHQLDISLEVLAKELLIHKNIEEDPRVSAFGAEQKWDYSRMPQTLYTNRMLALAVEKIRHEYSWFDWITGKENVLENRGFFEEISVNPGSGLPGPFDHIALSNHKKNVKDLLREIPTYEGLFERAKSILTEDYVELSEIQKAIEEIHTSAMKRNFVNLLSEAKLVNWEQTSKNFKPVAQKIRSLGGEELWNLFYIKYSLASGVFQAYVIDFWQDVRDPQVTEDERGNVTVSSALETSLNFADDNSSSYVIKSLDGKFKSIHPVHTSRILVGPFENKYQTVPNWQQLDITKELLKEDQSAALLRMSKKYSFAPNHRTNSDGELSQITYPQDWSEEYIVCAARYAQKVSSSILGTHVKVLQM